MTKTSIAPFTQTNGDLQAATQLRAVLFDLDGVIFDTETQYSHFWGNQCRHYFPDKPGLENSIKGQTLTQIYETVFASLPDEQPLITTRLNEFEEHMSFPYVAGAREFIEQLRSEGIRTAIVTSSNLPKMQNVYRDHPELSALFDAILTAEDFTESKPHPQCYLIGAQRLGVCPNECVGLEDSFNGLRAVGRAGMTVIALATTNSPQAIAPLADIVVSNFHELRLNDIRQLLHNKKAKNALST